MPMMTDSKTGETKEVPCLYVQDIADQLSFANASYFGSVFRKFAGVSPGEYRNAQGKK